MLSFNKSILIPGCGSRVLLQNALAKKYQDSSITCTDYHGVIELAKQKQNEINIEYQARNSAALGFKNKYDVVVIVNSVLSESDDENRKILHSCYEALKPGGVLMGFFPTVFATVDIAYLEKNKKRMRNVDIEKALSTRKSKTFGRYFTHR